MTFVADWSIWCRASAAEISVSPKCPTWESVEGARHKQREKFARSLGWRRVSKIGWLCPACYALRLNERSS